MRCGFDVRTAELNMRRRWSGLPQGPSRSNLLKRSICARRCMGGGDAVFGLRLMDVLRDDTMKVPVIEYQFICVRPAEISHGGWCSNAPKCRSLIYIVTRRLSATSDSCAAQQASSAG